MKTVKNVLIKLDLVGSGIVNMDSNDQKYNFQKNHKLFAFHDNVNYAKKVATSSIVGKDKSGNDKTYIDEYKIKISDDALLKSAYRLDRISLVPNIVHNPALLYSSIASPIGLIGGYMFPTKTETLKRTGSLKMSSAIQTSDGTSFLELFSRSGEKMTNDGTTDLSDTTLYFKETIGDISYSAIGNLDLMGLQFIPCDMVFDRYQLNPDYFKLYSEFLKKRIPNFNSELGYYQLKNTSIQIPEYGIQLSNENVVFLAKEALKRLLIIDIRRKGGFARTSSLKIKLVTDPLADNYNDEGWITLKSGADIDALDFETNFFYEEIDMEIAETLRNEIKEKIDEANKVASAAKKLKAETKKSKTKSESDE